MKNLQNIAANIVADALSENPTRWNTAMIQNEFDLDDQQVQRVKKYAKQAARDHGVMWGYDPGVKFFRVAPSNAPMVAHRMKTYVVQHWMDAGNNAHVVFEGARRQGYATDRDLERVGNVRNEFATSLDALGSELGLSLNVDDFEETA